MTETLQSALKLIKITDTTALGVKLELESMEASDKDTAVGQSHERRTKCPEFS